MLLFLPAAVAALALSVSASGTNGPYFRGGSLSGPGQVHPNMRAMYVFQAAGTDVNTLTVSIVLPKAMKMMKKGSPKHKLVDGKPTFVMSNLNNVGTNHIREFSFRVRVKRGAKPHKYWVKALETAQTGTWNVKTSTQIPAHVVKSTG